MWFIYKIIFPYTYVYMHLHRNTFNMWILYMVYTHIYKGRQHEQYFLTSMPFNKQLDAACVYV